MMQSSLIGCYYRLSCGVKPCHCCASIVCLQINSTKTWICSTTNVVRPPQSDQEGFLGQGQGVSTFAQHYKAGMSFISLILSGELCEPGSWKAACLPEKLRETPSRWTHSVLGFHLLWGTSITCPLSLWTDYCYLVMPVYTHTCTYLVISCWSLPKLSSKNKWFEGNSCGICMQLKGRKARCVW